MRSRPGEFLDDKQRAAPLSPQHVGANVGRAMLEMEGEVELPQFRSVRAGEKRLEASLKLLDGGAGGDLEEVATEHVHRNYFPAEFMTAPVWWKDCS